MDSIAVNMVYSTQQEEQCGVITVGNATTIRFGFHPGNYKIYPNQSRNHLGECLINRKMKLFPGEVVFAKRRTKSIRIRLIVYFCCVFTFMLLVIVIISCTSLS